MAKKENYKELGDLLIKTNQGDVESFEIFYKQTVSIQYYLALRYTRDDELAKDVVQELYAKLFSNIEVIKKPNLVVAYMNRMNHNISMKMIEKRNKEVALDYHEFSQNYMNMDSKALENERKNLVAAALDELDDELKEIIILRYIENTKVKDIAEYLNVSRKTVERKIAKGLDDLKIICKKLQNNTFSFAILALPLSLKFAQRFIKSRMSQGEMQTIYGNILKMLNITNFDNAANVSLLFATRGHLDKVRLLRNVVMISGTVVVGGSITYVLTAQPQFDIIAKYDNSAYVAVANYEIKLKDNENAREIIISDENKNILLAVKNRSVVELKIKANGSYNITVIGENYIKKTAEIIVDKIDSTQPQFIEHTYENNKFRVVLEDKESQININKIKIRTKSNLNVDFAFEELNNTRGVLIFESNEDVIISVFDNVGNESIGEIAIIQ